jgi:cell division protein FtsW
MKKKGIDKMFFGIVVTLVVIGVIMFTSASLGILAKNEAKFYNVILAQFILGLGGGFVAMYFAMRIPYKFWRQYSLPLFIGSIIITMLVFLPSLGAASDGSVFGISISQLKVHPTLHGSWVI